MSSWDACDAGVVIVWAVFDLINGLPVHPLVVHAVVVLLPLAILGTVLIVAVPRWRHHYGPVVLGVAALATVLIPVATSSGEQLEKHVGDPGRHAQLGDQLIWFTLPMLVVLAVFVWLERRRGPQDQGAPARPAMVQGVAALAVLAALAAGYQTVRVGDSGARAAWGDQVSSSAGN